ncbi:unnamed protein product [Mesocestoides corti]|uniref:Dendritic cell-specific transmembrane protein-like domain-containing protein n=1 Tax=Mesocestoides corti TaxID=53468 RepID=A0A0R3UF44_MESCO|nr:unnamed protein product [Mesocestoides corti]
MRQINAPLHSTALSLDDRLQGGVALYQSNNANLLKQETQDDNPGVSKSDLESKEVTNEGTNKELEAALQEEIARKHIDMILNRLEKPSRCSRLVSAFQKFLDRTCCKYTPRMYFTKPASWYSATAKLDAGTLLRENYLGITAGILVGYVTFFFFSAAFAHAPHIATLFACYVMMFSVFGIAFSSDFRCVLLITLPYLLASRTRWLLMMLATGLTTTGPALNFMHNSGNFRNAIACVLGQVSSNVELMGKITKAPLSLIKNQMGTMIGNLNDQLFRARNALRKIKQAVYMATKVLNSKSDWVRTMVESCGDEVAMKNQCLAFFNTLYFNCAASMKSLSFICNLLRMFAEQACKGVAGLNDICKRESGRLHSEITNMAPVSEEQLEESEESILRFMGRENISLETGGEFVDVDFGTNVSSQAEVTAMIEEKMDLMMNGLNSFKRTIAWIVTIWTLFTVIQLIVQSALYRKKWLTKPHYDNGYISPQFVEQERKAFENKRPTTLPLSFVEQWKYVTFSSLWWSKTERSSAFGSLAFLFVGVFVLILIIIADYAMYHIVLTTAPAFSEGFGKAKQVLEDGVSNSVPDFGMSATEQTVPEIQGNSSLSEMGRGFLALANPLKEVSFSVEASICRPRASKPDDVTTILVACSIALTLLSIVLQVYALRLRHIILAWYYPDGARRRAAWLRAYIRNTRGLFSRLLHKIRSRKLQPAAGSGPPGRLKFIDRFLFTNPVITGYLAKVGFKRVFCAQCYDAGNPAKKAEFEQKFAQCPRCGLYYCKTCQTDLQGICIYCNVPINTLSMEIDFERWSSDEEYDYFYNRYYTRRKHDESQLPAKPPSLEETVRPPSMKTRPRILLKRRIKPLIGMNIGAKFRAFLKGRGAKRVDKAVTTILTSLPSIPWWKRKRSTRRRRSRRRTRLVKEDKIKYFLEKVEEEVDVEEPEEVENPFRNRGTQTYLVRLSALRCGSASAWKESLKETGDFERSYVTGSDASSIGILGAIEPSIKSVFGDSDLCVVGDAEALGDHPTGEIYEPSIESVFGDSDLRVVGDAEALGDHPIGEINELISNENDVVGRANTGVQFIGDTQLNSTGVYLSPPKSPSYDISPCGEILPGAEMLREGSFKVNSLQHETGSCGLQLDALLSPECPGPFSSLILTSMSPIQHLPKDIKVDSGNDSFPREVGRDHKDSSLGPQISDLKSLSPLHLEVARKSLDLIVTGAEGCLDPEFAHVGSVNLLESSLKEDMVDNFDNKTAELGLPSLIKSNDSPIKDPLTPTLNASASHQTSTFKKDNSQKTDSRTKLVAGLNPAIKVVNTAPSQTQIKTKGSSDSLKSDQYLESSKRFCPADDGKQKSFKPHRVSTSSKHLKNSSIKNKPKKKFFEGPTSKIGSIEEKCASLTPVNPSSQSRATSDISMISVQGKSDTRIDIEPYLGGPEAIIGKSVYSEFKLEDTGPNTLSLDDNMTKIGLQDFTSGDEVVDVETDLGIGSGYLSPRPVATTQIVPILASNDGEEEERSVQLSPEAAIIASIEAANIDPSALLNVLRGIKLNPEISAIDSISSHVSEMSEISQDNQFSVIYDHQRKPKRELMKTKGLLLSPDKTRRVFEETEDTNQISDLDVEERNSCLSTPGTLYFNDSDTIDDSLGDNVTPLDADTLHDSGELKMEEESNSPALSQTSDFRHLSESDTDAFLKFDSNIQNTGKIFSSYSSGSNSLLQTTNKEQIDDISPVLSDCKGNDTTESESASFLFPDPKLTRWNCTNNTTPSSLEGSDLLAHGSIGHMSPLRFRNSSSGLTDYDLLMNDGQISPLDSSGCD